MNSKWMVIVNPQAKSGKVEKDWPFISELLTTNGIAFDSVFTCHKFHSVELTIKALRDGYRRFISLGGDGTINEVVNAFFFQTEVPVGEITLGVIPGGSGNDWIKMYGIEKDYEASIKAIAAGKSVLQDVGRFEVWESKVHHVRYMANIAGLGYDAMICYYCNKFKEDGNNGSLVYVRAALKALFALAPKQYRVVVDGDTFYEGKVLSVAFGNGRFSGGGMQQVPDAEVSDGLVNLTVVSNIPKFRIIRNFKKLFSGEIYSVQGILHTIGKKIEIFTTPDDLVEIDGEVVGTTPISYEILPKALRVICG